MPAKKSRRRSKRSPKRRYSRKSPAKRRRQSKRGFAARARGHHGVAGARPLPLAEHPLGMPKINPYNLPYRVNPVVIPYAGNVPANFLNQYAIKDVGGEYNNQDFVSLQAASSRVMPKPAMRSLWEKGQKKNQPLLDARYCGKGTLALGTDKGVWESTGVSWEPCKGGAANCYNPEKICSFYGPKINYGRAIGPMPMA